MSYLGAGADWRKRNYLIEPDLPTCANTGAVNNISDAAFNARWPGGVITFDEYGIGTFNPTFTPIQYGAVGLFQPYVSCGSYFLGQAQVGLLIAGTPSAPLAVDIDNSAAFIINDGARPVGEQRALSGTPFVNGPQCYLFTEANFVTPKPVVGVSINIGFLNETNSVRVRAYDADGNLLGTWLNGTSGGFENINLNRDSNIPIIAGITIENLGDTAGYSTSRVRFSNECA